MLKRIETEYKFRIKNKDTFFKKIEKFYIKNAYLESCNFVIDEIYGKKRNRYKVRKRTYYDLFHFAINTEIERTKNINGFSKEEKALEEIPKGFKLENSYNKVRNVFSADGCSISIDFYIIGVFCEIEGELKDIKKVAKKLGFNPKDNIKEGIDEIFCKEMKKKNAVPPVHWGF